MPVLASGRIHTGRLWTYLRDDRPFDGGDPPAALYCCLRDRRGEHPQRHLASYTGVLQADVYRSFNELYKEIQPSGSITQALCWPPAGVASSSWLISPPVNGAIPRRERQ